MMYCKMDRKVYNLQTGGVVIMPKPGIMEEWCDAKHKQTVLA